MLRCGLLHREHAGVYALAWEAPLPLAREASALLACGERGVLSHTSAGALWRMIPPTLGPVEVTMPQGERGRTRPGIRMHRTARLPGREVRIHQQLPVTSPARTLLDLCGQLPVRDVGRALDEALIVLKIVSPVELRAAVKRARGREGASVLAKLLDRRRSGAITQSKAERQFLELVCAAGLPEPKTQVRIAGFTVDFYWPDQRVAFEIDGYLFHTSRRAFDRDRRKDAALKAARVDPNRVSRDQVVHEPLVVLAYVAGALARAGNFRDGQPRDVD
jgi:very-short-patch-repair endonuclease